MVNKDKSLYRTKVTIIQLHPNQEDNPAFQEGSEVLILNSTSNQYLLGAVDDPIYNALWRYKSQVEIEVVKEL